MYTVAWSRWRSTNMYAINRKLQKHYTIIAVAWREIEPFKIGIFIRFSFSVCRL